MTQILTAREMLDRLIAFPTVSRDSNLPLIDWVEDYLNGHGITCHRDYDETGQKANLYAHIGPEIEGGVVLSGHTDVVPVDGQDWVTDPWTVVEKDGRLYGRGTTDMKGFVALALAAVPKMTNLKRPIQLALSYDEEVGLLGARPLVDAMKRDLPRASAVVVGEPTGMRVVQGHKSCDACFVDVTGFEVHSSKPDDGVSAIMVAARLINWLTERNATNRTKPVRDEDAMFDPPYTTLHVGMINGGTAHNITAKDCSFSVDVRNVPSGMEGRDFTDFQAFCAQIDTEIKAKRPEAGVNCRVLAPGPGIMPEPG
ncbi:MAG: acetylornithine deacetylase, partial [Pseudomonadota bacterium]